VQLDLAPFLAISVLLILIPGPDTAVVTKNALLGGRRLGVAAAVDVAFTALKIAGAVYLVCIGVQMLRSRGMTQGSTGPSAGRGHSVRAFRQGLLSDLSNPKIAVFFTSFLPQFVHGDGSAFLPLLVLGGIFAVLTLAWLAAYGVVVGHAAAFIRRPVVRKSLDRFTGVVLVGFGIRLAFERH
jgi:threonine/homoserine/homoserine lactone efflux protein